jgi:3-deoxy-D-manno-octulosonate 8-phosphate phosphatase (KDO 8-P phosphatase)
MQPALCFSPQLLLRAQGIKALLLDVDGVLTPGNLLFSAQGETLKAFNTLDGHGLKMLQRAGITPVVISGRDSDALRSRLQALGITHLQLGTEDKKPAAQNMLQSLGIDWVNVAAMGDDWPDLPLLNRAAFACAPPNAHVEVRAVAHYVTDARGGEGAVRELCDLLLMASGHYAKLLQGYSE